MATPAELPFRVGRWSRFVLLPWGVRDGHRSVLVSDDAIEVRFGWLTTTIPVADIARWDITGPYRWYRAIGIRHTLFSHDISCCGDASGAIRLWLRTPRRILFVRGATEVFLGIEDPVALGAWLAERGVSGEDLRAR
ncbi:MAG: hypothetical protein U0667_06385 [Chloroflexota bacterium]